MLSLFLAAITVSTQFEAGSLGKVERVSPTHLRCHVEGESDQDKRNRQANWYYFQLDGLPRSEIVLDLVDLVGEYNYRYGSHSVTKGTRPVYSYDRRAWTHFSEPEVEWDEKEVRLRLRFVPQQDRMWIAHVPPYTNQDLQRLLSEMAGKPYLEKRAIGRSVHGREILLLTVTNPKTAEAGKKVVWLMFRQHAWEAPTSHVCEGLLRFLLSDAPPAARIRDQVVFKIIPIADPDGVARGGVRFNANGYDLNRNWDAVDPARMPEIAAQRNAVLAWVDGGRRIDLFLAFHNTESAEYLEGSLPPAAGPLAERLFQLLSEKTTFNPTSPLRRARASTSPGKPGRMTVNQGLYHDRKIPAFLMEQMVEHNSKLGRLPAVQDRLEFGAALAQALCAAVAGDNP
jgi:murein tripeptide amidase MpaA